MTPENDLSIVERYGSFGLLVCLVLAFAFYVIPYCVRKFGEIVDKFDKALEAERHDRTAHDDRAIRTLSEVTAAVTQLVDRVERVESAGPAERNRSNKHAGFRHAPVHLRRSAP